jgi:hypothetical protein
MEAGPSKPTLGPDVPLFKEQPTRFTPGSGRKPHVPKMASPSDANGNHSERPASGNAPDKPACEWAHTAKVTWLPPLGPDDPIFRRTADQLYARPRTQIARIEDDFAK